MKRAVLACLAAGAVLSAAAQSSAQVGTYNGNAATGFGGPIGNGSLQLTISGANLVGTITNGGLTSPTGFNDELVIYLDTVPGSGFTSTSTLTDTADTSRKAISGFSGGSNRATLNFAPTFGADFAITLSPNKVGAGALFTLGSTSNFTYGTNGSNGNVNLTPTGTNVSPTYAFTIPLALIGSPTAFNFATAYLNGVSTFRSNEAFGNTITDTTNPVNTGNLGQDTGLVGFSTFTVTPVPEPATWAAGGLTVLVGFGVLRRRLRGA